MFAFAISPATKVCGIPKMPQFSSPKMTNKYYGTQFNTFFGNTRTNNNFVRNNSVSNNSVSNSLNEKLADDIRISNATFKNMCKKSSANLIFDYKMNKNTQIPTNFVRFIHTNNNNNDINEVKEIKESETLAKFDEMIKKTKFYEELSKQVKAEYEAKLLLKNNENNEQNVVNTVSTNNLQNLSWTSNCFSAALVSMPLMYIMPNLMHSFAYTALFMGGLGMLYSRMVLQPRITDKVNDEEIRKYKSFDNKSKFALCMAIGVLISPFLIFAIFFVVALATIIIANVFNV